MNVRKVKLGFILSFAVALFGCLSVSVSDERDAFSGASLQSQDPRCFGCDDVSDLMQCHECWGYHKRSDAHKEPPLVAAECPTCMSIHKFTESHVEPRPAVCGMACPICKGPVGPLAEMPHHCPHCPNLKLEPISIDFEALEKGHTSRIKERGSRVITNEEDWQKLLTEYSGILKDLQPKIDFKKEVVVAVFGGECPTGGYWILLHSVVEEGTRVRVRSELVHPSSLVPRVTMITTPFAIIKFTPSDVSKQISVTISDVYEK